MPEATSAHHISVNQIASEIPTCNAFIIHSSSTFASARGSRYCTTPAALVPSHVSGSYAEIPRLRLGMTRLSVRKWGCHSRTKARSLARFELRVANSPKGMRTPIPTLTDRARGLVLEAYLKDELTASTTAELLEQTLTTVQEYLTAQRMPVSRARAYQVQSHCYAAVE
ncbi:MAG: hypothetical protein QXI19_13700 [Candidatus Caldarchaeum sp.]